MNYEKSGDTPHRRVGTLSGLRDQQCALNRQMLLAIQLCDVAAQETIRARLAELQEEIDRITLRR